LKDPNPRASTLSIAKAARQDITAYPSVAENSGTDVRTAQHWMNRIMNMFNGQGEFSHQLVVSALLGTIPEPMSHRAQTFNFGRLLQDIDPPVNDDDNSDESEDEDDVINLAGSINGERPDLVSDSESDADDDNKNAKSESINANDASSKSRCDVNLAARNRRARRRVKEHPTSGVVKPDIVDGVAVFLTHDEAYKFRPSDFDDFTLYEFFCCVSILPKKKSLGCDSLKASLSSDTTIEGNDVDMGNAISNDKKEDHLKPGVKKTECFDFDINSPYYESHEIRPRTKIIIPKLQPTPPRYCPS
jgi:hypothetical protein